MTMYSYKLSRMDGSSIKYGPCEVCGNFVSDIFYQSESRETKFGVHTYADCHSLFGHEDCLKDIRR